ncbi:MAG: thioredoxin family protein [Flavobacteriaceae bacterium]
MARTPSNMLPLGTNAPQFSLFDTISGDFKTLEQLRGNSGTLVMFICNHCPFVIHVNKTLVQLANSYQKVGINCVAISSNDIINYPQDGPDEMKKNAIELNYSFPYLYDETQEIAKAYDAACTPDFFLFDESLKLVYRGQMDDSRPGNGICVNAKDLKHAMDCLLQKKVNTWPQKPSIGCNIKWK